MVKVVIPTEISAGERRVAAVPDTVSRLISLGCEVWVEQGAGLKSHFLDSAYEEAGARVVSDQDELYQGASVIMKVQSPTLAEIEGYPENVLVISMLFPSRNQELIESFVVRKISSLALELLPRISRAQGMDVLSSQASLAGYKAMIMAADKLDKIIPMQMTAAGTLAPARVFVMGAGVAGLQAIATARRLGAVIEAFDVRSAVKDQIESLGAKFVEIPLETSEGAGGYAAEQSEEYLKRQQALLAERVAASDIVITTAAIPGRKAPILVTSEMVRSMRPGSVIVDLASESGGNCELTVVGQEVERDGVVIIGLTGVPSLVSVHASQTYSRNVLNLITAIVSDGELSLDFSDELISSTCITYQGERRIELPNKNNEEIKSSGGKE